MNEQKTTQEQPKPSFRLTDPNFVWVPAAQTDVTRIWKKYGWVPPSEQKK